MRLHQGKVAQLQSNAANVRNICVLAHVDHGKTSLCDSLLATNGIISQRMAGKVRFLDAREDEQQRGITMESSAISLYFNVSRNGEVAEHLVNLIDSPGHIDFSLEVSTASRLCDGAVVLVDAVEGVCSQTVNVLRQCWVDRLKPLLVVNKVDRLVTEWELLPTEAYAHLARVIEQVNVVLGSFYAGDRMEDDLKWREAGDGAEYVERSDLDIYFAPEKNNVVFASAIDGWAFSVGTFARLYLAKLGFSYGALAKTLWGDYSLDTRNKKIVPAKNKLKPLFVLLVLEQIWAVYENCLAKNDARLEKIISAIGATVPQRDLRSKDPRALLGTIMSQWIPLSHAVLGAVIEKLPNPVDAQRERFPQLLEESLYGADGFDADFQRAILECSPADPEEHTLAYVLKMLSIPNDSLPKEVLEVSPEDLAERGKKARERAKQASETAAALELMALNDDDIFLETKPDEFQWEYEEDEEDEGDVEDETLFAFTRVYSGSLSVGDTVCVVGPKYDSTLPRTHPTNQDQLVEDVLVEGLFLIMGRDFTKVELVAAGNIVAVVGLGDIVLKNATIMSYVPDNRPYLNLALTSVLAHNKPILKVAVEPVDPSKLFRLEKGLDLLRKADPVLEWYIDDDSGELIVCAAGELHLERCLKDLETRFAPNVEVSVKEPVIPFRETVLGGTAVIVPDADDTFELVFDVLPLPAEVTSFLVKSEHAITDFLRKRPSQLKERLLKLLESVELDLRLGTPKSLLESIVAFGPKRVGANILVEAAENGNHFKKLFCDGCDERFQHETQVLNGFQMATNEGPLASEMLQGCAVLIRRARHKAEEELLNVSGVVLSKTKHEIHRAFLLRSPRLCLAMYTCEIQSLLEALGKVYAVIQKRGGTIINEEMKEGTPFFTISARIPVVEAFGFSEEIRRRTSGAASPQLLFDGFDVLDIDPFWVPHTEEELEELGTFAERENVARRYMNGIRGRKGLFVDEKVVLKAEKQRNMKRD